MSNTDIRTTAPFTPSEWEWIPWSVDDMVDRLDEDSGEYTHPRASLPRLNHADRTLSIDASAEGHALVVYDLWHRLGHLPSIEDERAQKRADLAGERAWDKIAAAVNYETDVKPVILALQRADIALYSSQTDENQAPTECDEREPRVVRKMMGIASYPGGSQ